ncbi:MAG: toxin-antitoxin system, antitoxin component, Xre family protein [Candidatus Coatesbacteria bacterium]
MSPEEVRVEELITRIRALPAERREAVERFVIGLTEAADDRDAVRGMGRLAESAFARIWDNPADAAYDRV